MGDSASGVPFPASGSTVVTQGTNPWIVSQGGNAWTVTANQGTSPWIVSQSGAWTVTQGTSPWLVSQSGIWNVAQSGTWTVNQGGAWTVAATQSGAWTVTQSGTWNVGISAGTNLIGQASASDETSTIYNGTTALTPQFDTTNTTAASGDQQLIAGVANKRIRVIAAYVIANASMSIFFRDGAGGTAISATTAIAGQSGFVLPYCPVGWFQTSVGNGLYINQNSVVTAGYTLVYLLV